MRTKFSTIVGLGLIAGALLAPRSASASFRKLFTDPEGYVASDNYWQCSPHVRRTIHQLAGTWGPFEFTCSNGTVNRIFAPAKSKINSKTAEFLNAALGLFELDGSSASITFNGKTGFVSVKGKRLQTVIQKFVVHGSIPHEQGAEPGSSAIPATTEHAIIEVPLPIPPDEQGPDWIYYQPPQEL